ncbi:uncharacterized protein LOC133507436 [Syngnathoides biaculeatus]|uniref:uncharacterized protein LOC133507436 n=1 Tax=Syngnathoides biaculeatus TaxID=300417 RepID=UPI002ADDC140|nr:uncharacterized protein LOC133507436 [Syngnathoides biaculeatus]
MNQEVVDFSYPVCSTVVTLDTPSSITHIDSPVEIDPLSSFTSLSCTPLPLELHIDEDGCSTPSFTAGSTVIVPSKKESTSIVTSDITSLESFSVSVTLKQPVKTELNSSASQSVTEVSFDKASGSLGKNSSSSSSPTSRNTYVVDVSNSSPVTSPIQCSPTQSPAPVHHGQEILEKNGCPVTPTTAETLPMSASPVTSPRLSGQVSSRIPKSPVLIPKLSSPVPNLLNPVTVRSVASSEMASKSCSPELVPQISHPVIFPKNSNPTVIRKSEIPVPKSPALVIKNTYMVADPSSNPRESPVLLPVASLTSPSSPPTKNQRSEIMDLAWPCREPALDNALDKLLAPDFTQPDEIQPPSSFMPGDECRPWDEDDSIYPDVSREGTLTPMTEASWIDECFTPSTCPGTPDATLDLPTQQPSAVERLSASGQVGETSNRLP